MSHPHNNEPAVPQVQQSFEELLRTHYVLREGRSPAGLLELIQWWVTLLAQDAGAVLDRAECETRPARPDEKSGRAILIDSRHIHHVEQTEPAQQTHVAKREERIAAGNTATQAAHHSQLIDKLRALFASAAARGIRLELGVERTNDPSEEKIHQALTKGYEGRPCAECGQLTVVRSGSLTKCDTCDSTRGSS
ncbi:MAG TPA: hypothetical protein VH092_21330 [Urbifossiella sp.]|nr:hypothetical protein [Urbifossiella sp.]